ncbi:hypothetical protein K456DRAFT_1757098 [Colletotrichum gloeosporioides 23]|nr:hypothetical protein K456DRAFT_1757098 [Colletotrichum gloeosporioides 23]
MRTLSMPTFTTESRAISSTSTVKTYNLSSISLHRVESAWCDTTMPGRQSSSLDPHMPSRLPKAKYWSMLQWVPTTMPQVPSTACESTSSKTRLVPAGRKALIRSWSPSSDFTAKIPTPRTTSRETPSIITSGRNSMWKEETEFLDLSERKTHQTTQKSPSGSAAIDMITA